MATPETPEKPLGSFLLPPRIFFEPYSIRYLRDIHDVSRVLIISDRNLYGLGYVSDCMTVLKKRNPSPEIEVFLDISTTPSIETVYHGMQVVESFLPDTFIALGGCTVLDIAKMMEYLYNTNQTTFSFDQKFLQIEPSVFEKKAKFIAIPTSSGSGTEVTPFAVIADEKGIKHTIADYSFLPEVTIVDPILTRTLPKHLKAEGGLDALTNAFDAYMSLRSSSYSDGLAVKAIGLLFEFLVPSMTNDALALEQVHNAATIAGMAVGNAFNGLAHTLAAAIESFFHIDHGKCVAIVLPAVIRLNGASAFREGFAAHKCVEIAEKLEIVTGETPAYEVLASRVETLVEKLELQTRFRAFVKEEEWKEAAPRIAQRAVSDPSGKENPAHPTEADLVALLLALF